jgi:phage terminase small subunit
MDYFKGIKEFKKLTHGQQSYLMHLVADPLRHKGNAAKKAGYKNPIQIANQFKKHAGIKKVLEQYDSTISNKSSKLKKKIIEQLSAIAFSNITDYMAWSEAHFDLKCSEDIPEYLQTVISEVMEQMTAHGITKKLKMHDKMKALDMLNKMHSFYPKDELEISNPDGNMGGSKVFVIPSNGREKPDE